LRRPALAALALLAAAWAVTLLVDPWADERVNDLTVYRSYAELFLDGRLPYRDVAFEYPPLTAPLLTLPGLVGTGYDEYRLAFAGLALALAAGLVLLCGALAERTGGDPRRAMLAIAVAPLLTGAMIRNHFDIAPVVLVCGALLALVAARPRLGFALLGAGAVTKIFPVVVVPVAVAWLLGRGERRAALEGLGAFAATVGVVSVAALALSPGGYADSFEYHLDRPVQVESVPAIGLIALDTLGAGEAEVVDVFKSQGLEHPASDVLLALALAVMLGALAGFALGARGRPDARGLVLASLGAVAAFAALGKVLSPQFLVWVLPLGALALAWRMHALAGIIAAATVLTLVEFPARYFDYVARESFPVALVVTRDALLLAAVAVALWSLRSPAPAAARSTWPARRRLPRPARR
jgi:uncharacterized membrane protein